MTEQIDRTALGLRLKEAREYRGFSQEDVAGVLGVSRSAISMIETGARRLDIFELKKLAHLYGCHVAELTGEQPQHDADQESIKMVARAAAELSPEDRSEVLRFAEFLRNRPRSKE